MVRVLSEVGTLKYPESDLSFSPVLDNQWNNFLSILPQQRIRVDSCKIYIQGVSHHPAWLLCDPKTGRKFPLGQKHLVVSFIVSQIGDCLKEEFQDLGILARYTGYPISRISSLLFIFYCHRLYKLNSHKFLLYNNL